MSHSKQMTGRQGYRIDATGQGKDAYARPGMFQSLDDLACNAFLICLMSPVVCIMVIWLIVRVVCQ